MSTPTKPILYNGFKINDLTVTGRIEKVFFTEVYNLSDSSFLYLFTTLKINEVRGKGEKLVKIESSGNEYLGLITDTYSQEKVTQIIDSLTHLNGFDAVAGMQDLKKTLIEDVIKPLQEPDKYQKFKLTIPNGVLLFGPPGCGKTYIVRKLAEEIGYNYIEVKASDIGSKYIHDTTVKIGRLFNTAKLNAPSLIFLDDIESIIPKREHLDASTQYRQEEINEFQTQLNDAGKNNVLVVLATNRPDLIDISLLRAGRMDKRIYVGPPDALARKELFRMYLSDRPVRDIDYEKLAELTNNYVSVDIEYIATESAREAVARNLEYIDQATLEKVIAITPPSVTDDEIAYYKRFSDLER